MTNQSIKRVAYSKYYKNIFREKKILHYKYLRACLIAYKNNKKANNRYLEVKKFSKGD